MRATLARIEARNGALGAFTDVTADAGARQGRRDRRGARQRRGARPARRRAFRGQEPVRHRRPADPRRLEDQPRPAARRRRRDAGRSAWRRRARSWSARSTWANTPMISPARTRTTARRAIRTTSRHMSGGSSGGSGTAVAGGHGAAGARLRHQWLDPRAVLALRHFRPEADLRTAVARAAPFPSSPASIISARSRARSPISRSPTTRCSAPTPDDPGAGRCRGRSRRRPSLDEGIDGLRIATLGGYFARGRRAGRLRRGRRASPRRWASNATVELPQAERARAAAYLITMAEGAALHLDRLRARAGDFDPDVRDRLIAGAMLPGAWIVKAQKFRRWFRDAGAARCSATSTSCSRRRRPAARRGSARRPWCSTASEMLVRPNLGLFTQPISFIGLPVVTVPVWTRGREAADRRADHRARRGARISRCASRGRWSAKASSSAPIAKAEDERHEPGTPTASRDGSGRNSAKDVVRADVWRGSGRRRRQCRPDLRPHPEFRRRRHGRQAAERTRRLEARARRQMQSRSAADSRCACARSTTASCCSRRCPI